MAKKMRGANVNHDSKNRSTSFIQFGNHPFPVLLYLEWGLLAIGLLSALVVSLSFRRASFQFPFIPVVIIVIFGLIGLRLPTGKVAAKVHTAIALILIIIVTVLGMRSRLFTVLHLYPFLYVILVIRSCLMFRRGGRTVVTATAFILFLTALFYRLQNADWIQNLGIQVPVLLKEKIQDQLKLLNFGFAFTVALLMGLALLFIFLLVNALLSERQSREQMAIANQQLRQYALRVETLAMEQERNRIARDIHDSLGHSLTALNLQIEGALRLWQINPNQAQTFLREAKQMGSMALQEVRQSVSAMRADPLQGQGLEAAIALLVQDFQRSTEISPACHFYLPSPLSTELKITVYRIVQEALTNISKHAHATQVNLTIQALDSGLQLVIYDNGQGFEWQQNQTGFGLQGIRERVLALGGQLAIASAAGQGCRITVDFPHKNLHLGKP
jgi:signal transduction histidine kinase